MRDSRKDAKGARNYRIHRGGTEDTEKRELINSAKLCVSVVKIDFEFRISNFVSLESWSGHKQNAKRSAPCAKPKAKKLALDRPKRQNVWLSFLGVLAPLGENFYCLLLTATLDYMCGICGSFSIAGLSELDTAATIGMMKLMERRGPDDEGLWTEQKYCALGFRRLSILDLSSTGHQPMTTPDGRYVIVYNGEVYNFRELREELQQRGIRFRSSGDSGSRSPCACDLG